MSIARNSAMPFRHKLVIIFLCNYIISSNCLDLSNTVKDATDITKTGVTNIFGNLTNAYALPADVISKNTNLYLASQQNEDIYLNGTQLIQKYGYEVEEHHVTTSDGYNLALYRIPGKGRLVFLMHGLFNSFVDWLTAGPDKGLAYLLASQGCDVWMGNSRGVKFSQTHERLTTSDPKYWEFSFNEIGTKDLPAMIDYTLAKTGKEKLSYIGHSQGTTSFFVLCSTMPEYNDKIDFMIALSAVAWMKHCPNPILQLAAPNLPILYALRRAIGLNEVAPDNALKEALLLALCGDSLRASIICQNVVFLIAGFDYSQINYEQSPVMFKHFPSACSVRQLEHYTQLIVSGYFRKYDYGSVLNLNEYGSVTPPSYPVDKITVPIAIFHSQGDWLVSTTDVDYLRSKLNNVVEYYEVPLKTFNHIDFLWAKDVKILVYDRVLTLIKEN